MTALQGFPKSYTPRDDGGVDLQCNARVYPVEAVFAATYALLDRGYFRIDRDDEGNHTVEIHPKEGEAVRDIVGSLTNELLSAVCRTHLHQRKEVILESVTLAAMAGAVGRPDLDDLEDFDFSEEGLDDPLGIAVSWEEKYKSPKTTDAEADSGKEPS